MTQNLSLSDVNLWRTELGLLPVPLFGDQEKEGAFVLLNGMRGNFCLDFGHHKIGDETRNFAWSSNVGHYVELVGDHIEVQRWDQKRAAIERYNLESIRDNLEKFHAYLEMNSPRHGLSVVSHVIGIYRSLRAVLGNNFDGPRSLRAFLYLLACAADRSERGRLALSNWRLSEEAAEIVSVIREAEWLMLQNELVSGRPIESLVPDFTLLLRHASGHLFQEAHYEAVFISPSQLTLNGFLPSPIEIGKESKGIGLHFTPPALARTLVEEAFAALGQQQESIFIFDPACGSGEFLREALRQLKLKGYTGAIKLVGWDISEAACDMANFILAWETRNIQAKVSVKISCVNSLFSDQQWPENVDLVLMNPPFVSWQEMNSQQRNSVTEILGELAKQRPDLSHAFLLKASSCLRKEGVLGTILPASLLDGHSADKLRKRLVEQISATLIARLGSHLLFSSAMIDAAIYVGKKGVNTKELPPVAFWADHRANSSSAGLRALRKIRYLRTSSAYPVIGDGFSIYLNPRLGHDDTSWAPRPYKSWKLLQRLEHLPKVKDLFNVKQGIRTGNNQVFLISKIDWMSLPKGERQYFRPAVVNKSIDYGVLNELVYVFFPYGELKIKSEKELQKKLEIYFKQYLLPSKSKLLARDNIVTDRWWELSRNWVWQVDRSPKLVSTYFGDAGSFAWDETGDFVVVQGFGWFPKRSKSLSKKVGLAYLAVLNSAFFSELLSATSNHVGGGQWNLSKKFVDPIAIPDLLSEQFSPLIVSELSAIGARIHAGARLDDKRTDELLLRLYGIGESL